MPLTQPSPVHRAAAFDPKAQPVVPGALLPSLPSAYLTLDHIRRAFSQPSPWEVEPLFAKAFEPEQAAHAQARRAAVLMPLVQRPDGLHVVFTRRSEHLHHHAGQISFPGGCIESGDAGPVAAALRETDEEIGVDAHFVRILGTLPTLLTTTGFLMTPVVAELETGFRIRPQDSEVAEVFEVPLVVLMDPSRYELRHLQSQSVERYFYAIPWETHFIWGATATLARNLYHFLAASFSATMR